MSVFGLTDAERKELADSLGHIVAFFVESAKVARGERDAALAERDTAVRRAERAERTLSAYKGEHPDGAVLATNVSASRVEASKPRSDA